MYDKIKKKLFFNNIYNIIKNKYNNYIIKNIFILLIENNRQKKYKLIIKK